MTHPMGPCPFLKNQFFWERGVVVPRLFQLHQLQLPFTHNLAKIINTPTNHTESPSSVIYHLVLPVQSLSPTRFGLPVKHNLRWYSPGPLNQVWPPQQTQPPGGALNSPLQPGMASPANPTSRWRSQQTASTRFDLPGKPNLLVVLPTARFNNVWPSRQTQPPSGALNSPLQQGLTSLANPNSR